MKLFRKYSLLTLLAFSSVPQPAGAAALRISPIGVDIRSDERAAAVTIFNSDNEPVTLQVRLYKWRQVDGEDRLEQATDLIASPPSLTIAPNKSFTLRVARPSTGAVGGELSYRLFIDELPKPIDPRAVSQGVRMVLRTSMPVFVVDKTAVAKLTWHVWEDKGGVHAEATNSGLRHAKIGGLRLELADGSALTLAQGLAGYVLAGSTKRFNYQPSAGSSAAHLKPGDRVTVIAKNDLLDIREPIAAEVR
ncbi:MULTISPECIES: molecular chaperone [unclassified Novosphingobium]|uniref:fimbrial biogenesis chaperone n=1 Tax=unclassified Novosphingobium TaxID=2644732 RepID=UPI001469FD77|nr:MULTISPECIES: molecular chaperone [unclassified Novosphingobium]NMN03842.1 fimbrial chaperone protein [Novosphingobium sp. SG919]NMN86168.1 fimbrial chaperone protein [Novosphingobium sp. SG916]